MIAWLSAAPSLLIALALATLPGLPAAIALRFRGLALIAASVAASFASIAIASIVSPMLGVSWSILPVLGIAALLAILCFVARRFLPVSTAPRSGREGLIALAAALALAACLIAVEILSAIGSPEFISQTYDGVFHLNATSHILMTGDSSPLHMNLNVAEGSTAFYPTLWHATVALIVQLGGASVPLATNALALVTAAWIWPVAILFFARPFFARRPAHLLLGAVLASSFTAFPYLLLTWGVLYPNLLSTALLPIGLGFAHLALRNRSLGTGFPPASLWIAALGGVGAAAFAHPNALFGFAALSSPLLLVIGRNVRQSSLGRGQKTWRYAALLAVFAFYAVLWFTVKTGDNQRGYENSIPAAFITAISNAPLIATRAWFLTVLVAGGIIALIVGRRHRWLIGSYAVAVALYTVSSGFEGPIRAYLTGAWYNDAHRLASLLPVVAVPLAAVAAAHLLDFVIDGARRIDPERVVGIARRGLPAVCALLVIGLLLTGGRNFNLRVQTDWMRELYLPRDDSPLLSNDERELLERLDSEVSEDARIAGDPWSGTGLATAISHRAVLFPHFTGTFGDTADELASDFAQLDRTDACRLLDELEIDYMLDFGDLLYDIEQPEAWERFEGLRDITDSPALTEIDREGDAVLLRVTCE